jgi:hypothetical protein
MKKIIPDKIETPETFNDNLVMVVLLSPHVHAGALYNAGEHLKVNPAMKKWLIDLGVVAPDEPKTKILY